MKNLLSLILFAFALSTTLEATAAAAKGKYAYLVAYGNDIYISNVVLIPGESIYDDVYKQNKQKIVTKFITQVLSKHDERLIENKVYVVIQESHLTEADVQQKMVEEIQKSKDQDTVHRIKL